MHDERHPDITLEGREVRSMMGDIGSVGDVGEELGERFRHHRVERLLIVRPEEGADAGAAGSELEDLPGVVGVTLNTVTDSFDVLFDPAVVSDDELAASLHHQGYDLIGWQEVRAMHSGQQRAWLLEQIRSLTRHAEIELAQRGPYADGVTKGSVDAYVRAARAFGLVTDAEIVELIPAHFLEGPA
jgi:copper chaperone CopZ